MHEGQVDSSSPPYYWPSTPTYEAINTSTNLVVNDVQPNQSRTHNSGEGGPSKSKFGLLDYLEEKWHYSPNKKSM